MAYACVKNCLTILKHSTYFYKKHVIYNGVKLSNGLPLSIKLESRLQKFKGMLKRHLIGWTCFSVREFLSLMLKVSIAYLMTQ